MPSIEGLKRRLTEYQPKVQSAFVVFVTPRESPVQQVDDQFDMVIVNSADDPLLARICSSKYQLRNARKALAEGRWRILVALKDGEPVGRIWEALATERGLFTGIPRVRLAAGETFMFDLYVDREYRRSGIAMTMADFFFKQYDPATMNYLAVGPNIKWKLPFSDMPRFGPMGRKGRHTDPSKDIFGLPLFP